MRRLGRLAVIALVFATTASAAPPASRFHIEYRVVVPPTERAKRLALWIPYPAEDPDQKVLNADVRSPLPWEIRTERRFGNRMVFLQGKGSEHPTEVLLSFEIERSPSFGRPRSILLAGGELDPDRYRDSDRLVPIDRQIRAMAAEATRDVPPGDQAKAIYDYVVRLLDYNKEGTGWGRGDVAWVCANRRGNCTDFHSLFIALARARGIPARFVIGLPIPAVPGEGGVIPGYHCWAEFFDEAKGWRPVDATEGKKSGRPDDYFGKLPSNRVQFAIGRDVVLEPPQSGGPLNFFIEPYAEADGKPVAGLTHEFRYERSPVVSSAFPSPQIESLQQ